MAADPWDLVACVLSYASISVLSALQYSYSLSLSSLSLSLALALALALLGIHYSSMYTFAVSLSLSLNKLPLLPSLPHALCEILPVGMCMCMCVCVRGAVVVYRFVDLLIAL